MLTYLLSPGDPIITWLKGVVPIFVTFVIVTYLFGLKVPDDYYDHWLMCYTQHYVDLFACWNRAISARRVPYDLMTCYYCS